MKKLTSVIFLLLFGFTLQAQSKFEGRMVWIIQGGYIDSAQAKEIKKTLSQFNTTEGIQKLNQMEQQMSDPRFLKYMEENPGLKEQLEQTIRMIKTIQQHPEEDPMLIVMPKEMNMQMKDSMYYVKTEGGISPMIGDVLRDSTGKRYLVNVNEKIYSEYPVTPDTAAPKAKITLTKEKQKIMNYDCKKYLIEVVLEGKKVTQEIWTTTKLKSFNSKVFSELNIARSATGIDYSKLKGVPLKVVLTTELKVTFTAVELKKEKINPVTFHVPKDFKETNYGKAGIK
ncbi:MAG TPA: hypothetical protein VNB90_13395 [Cytophagaceae bacterium]|nr:hypothetical protein [Cytophagaceae bacterium]